MRIYNQRDSKWSHVTLGTKGTIGNLGCTITAIAQLLTTNGYNITPPQVNDRLKAVGGYSNGNLVIWSKLSQAYPQIKSATRHWSYNNDTAVKAIKDNKGVLVEVDGSRIGAPKHWVLYIGNGQMTDSWFGTMKSTNYYRPTGMAVLEVQSNQEVMPKDLLNKYGVKDIAELDRKIEEYVGLDWGNANNPDNKSHLAGERRKSTRLTAEVKNKQEEIDTLKGEVAEKASALKTVREELNQFMQTLSTKLSTIVDKSEIIGAVDRLISNESELIKKASKLEKKYYVLEEEKKREIGDLKRELEELRQENSRQAKHIKRLEDRVDGIEDKDKQTRSLYDVIKDFLSRFIEDQK